jgi:hypothetical protein
VVALKVLKFSGYKPGLFHGVCPLLIAVACTVQYVYVLLLLLLLLLPPLLLLAAGMRWP